MLNANMKALFCVFAVAVPTDIDLRLTGNGKTQPTVNTDVRDTRYKHAENDKPQGITCQVVYGHSHR